MESGAEPARNVQCGEMREVRKRVSWWDGQDYLFGGWMRRGRRTSSIVSFMWDTSNTAQERAWREGEDWRIISEGACHGLS